MVNDIGIDRTLSSLADPTRRAIVTTLASGPRTFGELSSAFPISDPAVSRHLRVLRETGLVSEERVPDDGRKRLYSLRPNRLRPLDTWLAEVTRYWQTQLSDLRMAAMR